MNLYFVIVIIFIVAIVDTYFYYSLNQVIKGPKRDKVVPKWIRNVYWSFTIFTILFFFIAMYYYIAKTPPPKFSRVYITGFILIVLVSKLVGIVFFLLDDLKKILIFLIDKIFPLKSNENSIGSKISRNTFIKQTGIIAAAIPFVTMMYGVVKTAFDYNVIRVKIKVPNLPSTFNGFRIVQISDIHTGSFISGSPLKDAVKLINDQNPDVVFFTGDLVNEIAEEALPFIDILKNIKAKHGVFSILGNHDYGDYFYQKGDVKGKTHNYKMMQEIHHKIGWDLLLNENRFISIGEDKIGLIGVENWGKSKRFQKYGNIDLAINGINQNNFNILLSHDPSHWDAVVRKGHENIDLTLSGHTHGFQMGIEIPGYFKWSPSQYLYKQWAGLYQEDKQLIYVNRGLGFLGYPGRIGILPEITVIELENNNS